VFGNSIGYDGSAGGLSFDASNNVTFTGKVGINDSVDIDKILNVDGFIATDTIVSSGDTVFINDNLKVSGTVVAGGYTQDTIVSTGDTVYVNDVMKIMGQLSVDTIVTTGATINVLDTINAAALQTGSETFTYSRDTFSLDLIGCSDTATHVWTYEKFGQTIFLHVGDNQCTGDTGLSQYFCYECLPSAIRPATDNIVPIAAIDSGEHRNGQAWIQTDGDLYFWVANSTGDIGNYWRGGGSKMIPYQAIVYRKD
jgi:hypothetical protein